MLPARRMAHMVYRQLLKATSEMQQEVARQIAVNEFFGPDALPVNMLRLSHLRVLSDMRESPNRIRFALNKKIQDNVAIIAELEKLFAEKEEPDIETYLAAMSARWKGDDSGEVKDAGKPN